MSYNPSIYEINTRVFLKRFGNDAKVSEVPEEIWRRLADKKFDFIWLMGVWKISSSSVEKYCFEEYLIKNYSRALKNWQKEDIIGSPFAIDVYEINESLGSVDDLINLKAKLNRKGIGLILDFVPNHFNAETSLLKINPGIFLSVDKESFLRDPHTYYQPDKEREKYFAHGRDPFFAAWQDTIQVNFFSISARNYLTNVLLQLTDVCDGVRCDMAMLALNNVFKNTWSGVISKNNYEPLQTEFWSEAIQKVKSIRKDFLFIAEAYWNLEWELQQLGFDYTYDKSMTDRLRSGYALAVKEHLFAEKEYRSKSLHFIENHDEERAFTSFGKEKSKAAALIISTIEGMRFFHDGQLEGKRIKLPVQLGKEPPEHSNSEMIEFYNKLFSVTANDIFKEGTWSLLETITSWEGNTTFKNMLAYQWMLGNQKRLVIVNYSDVVSSCRLKFDITGYPEEFEMEDLLNNQKYIRSGEEIISTGLYVELKPWHAHIFSF
ncbi:MAG: alpha-amylase family glycosyl hydrolase [Melioribacteraceae bacterium]|nr:alpha-amylase family glycosyl hydrolase [Melioribacteraceae bacterium]